MRFQDIPINDVLETFKRLINDNQMNLLVGTGISCCACDLYKNWIGLLSDMVACLYAEELTKKQISVNPVPQYYYHYEIKNIQEPSDTDYVYDAIKTIVEREGVLSIPSQFVERTGLRESIEAYVESHTPVIDVEKNMISLFGETRIIDREKDFYFLTEMINAGWNAILPL